MGEIDREALRAAIGRLEQCLAELEAGRRPVGVNLKTAASVTGYSAEAVRQWAARGQIVAERHGGVWRVDLPALLAFVAARRRATG